MAATKNPAPGWDRRGALGNAVRANGDQELPSSPFVPQRTGTRPAHQAVILSRGIQRNSPSDRAGRPVFIVELASANGAVRLVAICWTRKAADDEVLRHLVPGIAFVDQTGGA